VYLITTWKSDINFDNISSIKSWHTCCKCNFGIPPIIWRLVSEVGQLIACILYKVSQLFWRQTWDRIFQCWNNPMPCLASIFDGMSGIKKLTTIVPAITCSTSSNEPLFVQSPQTIHCTNSAKNISFVYSIIQYRQQIKIHHMFQNTAQPFSVNNYMYNWDIEHK